MIGSFFKGLSVLAVCLLPLANITADEPTAAIEKCGQNLSIVFDAIQAYRRELKTFPDRLEQLVPDYLRDPSYLVCPLAQRDGDNIKNRERLAAAGVFDSFSSYDYELSDRTKNTTLLSLNKSPQEYKLRQRALLGDVVPLLRCLRHPGTRHRLNISFKRELFESGDYWEVDVRHLIPHFQLMPQWVFSDRLPIKPRLLPRWGGSQKNLLDLTERYNCHPSDGWLSWDLEDTNTLRNFPAGLFSFKGIEFDARGLFQLEGLRFPQPAFPDGLTNIPVKMMVRRIHLLHATEGEEISGREIAVLVAKAPLSTAKFPIRYGIETRHWWFDPNMPDQPLENGQVAWTGENPAATCAGKKLRLFVSTFEMPAGSQYINGLDYLSGQSHSAPFLLAVTVE